MDKKRFRPVSRPILVTGNIRSGTTWLGRLLATCDNTFYIHEPFNPDSIWNAAFPTPIQNYYLCEENGFPYKQLLRRILQLNPKFKGQWKKSIAEQQTKHIRAHSRHIDSNRAYVPIIKDPTALYSSEWLYDNFRVKPVILLRNPISIVRSLLRLGWASNLTGSAIRGQPLLLSRICAVDPEVSVYGKEATWDGQDPLTRAVNFVGFNYRFIAAMKRLHPDWHYINYEWLTHNPDGVLELVEQLEMTPTDLTRQALYSETEEFDSALAHQRTLKPHPVDTRAFYTEDDTGVDWRKIYASHFQFVADSFPQYLSLAVPEQN